MSVLLKSAVIVSIWNKMRRCDSSNQIKISFKSRKFFNQNIFKNLGKNNLICGLYIIKIDSNTINRTK